MHILVIEDSVFDYTVVMAQLSLQGVVAQGLRVQSATELRQALAAQEFDLVISDHQLPGFSSDEAFTIVRAWPTRPPFIIVSGMIGEEAAVAAMRRGVDDYLLKSRLARLGMAVRNALRASAMRREKAQAQAQLAESQQQLANLSARQLRVLDEERALIARELHDEVGGALTAVKLDLEVLLAQLPQASAEAGRASRALASLAQAAQAAQRIMQGLHPPILEAGLVAALQWQLAQFRERTGIKASFHSNVLALTASRDVEMTAYRACQEGLTNIIKHAGADSVWLDLHHGLGTLSMEIGDNGRGFDGARLRDPASLGLRGLRERARAVGGHLDISCAAGRTALLLSMPLDGRLAP